MSVERDRFKDFGSFTSRTGRTSEDMNSFGKTLGKSFDPEVSQAIQRREST